MNILLDTHIVLWMLASPKKMPRAAVKAIEQAHQVFFSPMNLWEIGTKSALWPKYKLSDVAEIHAGLLLANVNELPVRSADTILSTRLPMVHRDPIDRMLLAQSHNNQYHLLTVDEKITDYKMPYVLSV